MYITWIIKGDFTQGCTLEAQAFERDIDQYKKLGVQIVGVSVDSVDKHLDFSKKYGLDFPLLSDQGMHVCNILWLIHYDGTNIVFLLT